MKYFLTLFFSYLFLSALFAQQDGATLFKTNCAACHRTDDKRMTGPGLQGVFQRTPSEQWLFGWIRNSQKVVASGDAYGNKIFEEYGKIIMPPQEFLTDEQISAILAYIKNPPAAEGPAPIPATGNETKESDSLLYILLIITLLLLFTIFVLSSVRRTLQNVANAKKGLPPLPAIGYSASLKLWILSHKVHTAVIIILLLVYGSVKAWYAMQAIGVYQGYAPEQPIKFSHKTHAGQNQIDCQYCHHSAAKGKMAGIPSVNVCMNCHKGISKGATTGTAEIAKIYAAAGFSPETQKYDKPQKPIKWIRVHNLPDFAYFNHSQHVVVGKQTCQACHGKVQEMDVLKQESPLTMGWCVQCHRTTNAATAGNGYYEELHARVKLRPKAGKDAFTVANLGGLECSKCHY